MPLNLQLLPTLLKSSVQVMRDPPPSPNKSEDSKTEMKKKEVICEVPCKDCKKGYIEEMGKNLWRS